jgi:hypothetical protein
MVLEKDVILWDKKIRASGSLAGFIDPTEVIDSIGAPKIAAKDCWSLHWCKTGRGVPSVAYREEHLLWPASPPTSMHTAANISEMQLHKRASTDIWT